MSVSETRPESRLCSVVSRSAGDDLGVEVALVEEELLDELVELELSLPKDSRQGRWRA